ncbi:MAG: TonB-dependent siderophore receptor [Acetobacteraceae bacterium]|nr:TonB-dependent siderophore receptor [Acetobacteraceae bacterium]
MSLRRPLPTLQPSLGIAGIGLLAALPAVAQTPPAALALPEIDVRTEAPSPYRRDAQPMVRLPTTVADTPQSVSVVPKEVMQERGANSVREALRNVTGISLAAGEGGASGDNLTLRGFSARTDFYIDGIRDIGQYTRDPFFLDSIEVLKGPSSVAFGRGSTGGVINQTTRLPQPLNFGEVTLSAYSPMGLRSTADVNLAAGDVAARLAAMATHVNVANRDHVYNERWGVAPSVTWGINGPTQLTLSYLHQSEQNIPDYGVPFLFGRPAPVPHHNFYGQNGVDQELTETDVATLRLSHRFNDSVTLRNTLRMGNYARELRATAPRIIGSPTPQTPLESILVNRQAQFRNALDTQLVNQTEAVLNFRTGPLTHAALVGFEIGRESSKTVRFTATGRPPANLLFPNWNDSATFVVSLNPTNGDVRTVADTIATYAIDQIRIGEMFEVLLGGRWDRFDADFRNRTTGQAFSRLDDMFSWRAALVFKPIPSVRTYFAYGTSFNPSAESLTLAANNANLAPEKNESFEIGASWEALEGLRLSGALFRINKTNARTPDPVNGTLLVLAGQQRVDGFELQATGRITRDWNIIAAYTYLSSEILSSNTPAEVGKELPNVAPSTAALWTTYDLPLGFQIGGGLSYIGRRYADTANTNKVPGYVRYDAALSWQPQEGPLQGLRLQLNALNLGDTRFYESVYPGHAVPGAGRTFILTAAARF